MLLERLLTWLKHETWEAHYDYCNVFNEWDNPLTASGNPCNEDCANHPGSKVRLGSRGTVWYA